MASVAAYIDGFNLYFGMRHKYGRKYHWLDVVDLIRQVRPKDDIAVVRYFTAIVKGEPAAAANQMDYLRALRARNGSSISIHVGWFRSRSSGLCAQCGQRWACACPRRYRTHEEKETDVALGATMVEDAALGIGETTLLVSADSDFAPAVAAVKRIDPSRPVLIALPPGNVKPHRRFVDVGYFNLNEVALRRAQLPATVAHVGEGQIYARPGKWA